jgi:hypothetical protein
VPTEEFPFSNIKLLVFLKVIGATVKKDGELLESLDFDAGGISKSVDWQGGGEFIYSELDKYNQKYIDKKNILDIFDFFIFIHFHYMKMHRL